MAKFVICPHEENGEECGVEVRSSNSEEVVRRVQKHAQSEHDLELTKTDVERMMESE